MLGLMFGIVGCVVLAILAVLLIYATIGEGDLLGFVYVFCCVVIIILLICLMCEPAPYSNHTKNYNEYHNLMIAIEDVADNPNSITGDIVRKQVDEWNEKYDEYTAKIGNLWDGRKYSTEAFADCEHIDFWSEIYKFQKEVVE